MAQWLAGFVAAPQWSGLMAGREEIQMILIGSVFSVWFMLYRKAVDGKTRECLIVRV